MRSVLGVSVTALMMFLMVACENSGGGGAVRVTPETPQGADAPISPADPAATRPANIVKREITGGHHIYFNTNTRETIALSVDTWAFLELSHENGIPNANLGFLTGYTGDNWAMKCHSYKQDTAFEIRRYRDALTRGADISSSKAALESALKAGTLPIGVMTLRIDFGDETLVEKFVRANWPADLPTPSSVRSLRQKDVRYDVMSSTATPEALTFFDGQGMMGLEQVVNQPIRAYMNQFCDVLNHDIKVTVRADEIGEAIPIEIFEAEGGVHPR